MNDASHFLVIGAQKCGTTTLYEDLRSHPDVALAEKESSLLLSCDVSSPVGRNEYWSAFRRARPARATGEVTTEYSMLPRIDAATRAREMFDSVKIVYIVRDPIERIISNHHHAVAARYAPVDINRAIDSVDELLDNSRYLTQIRPWVDGFGLASVHIVHFERYMADRQGQFGLLAEFLALPPHDLPRPGVAHNAANQRVVATGAWRRLRSHWLYRKGVRALLPVGLRRRIVRLVLPTPPERPPAPSQTTLNRLVSELQPEVDGLAALLETEPWWDLARTHRRVHLR